ncbi:MAG: hypothetical protein LBG45_04515 [Dysgonamonadaceae bacterium]|jgi:hypothetical protein|nr:hypothetical protein [Dysgonamonadaceae bacterium]
METVKHIFLAIIGSLVFIACDEYEFLNLKRDNPLDGKYNAGGGNTSGSAAAPNFNSYSVYSDNNNDKVINKGETIELQILLKITGASTAKGIKATFSTASEYVSGFTPISQINYGDISVSGIKWANYLGYNSEYAAYVNYYTVKFSVSNTAPNNTVIPISIDIVDENGNTWTSSFNVYVQ